MSGGAWLRLAHAALCLDCEAVYELERLQCPACGSGSAVTLARFLESRASVASYIEPYRIGDRLGYDPILASVRHAFERFPSHDLCCRRCGESKSSPAHLREGESADFDCFGNPRP